MTDSTAPATAARAEHAPGCANERIAWCDCRGMPTPWPVQAPPPQEVQHIAFDVPYLEDHAVVEAILREHDAEAHPGMLDRHTR